PAGEERGDGPALEPGPIQLDPHSVPLLDLTHHRFEWRALEDDEVADPADERLGVRDIDRRDEVAIEDLGHLSGVHVDGATAGCQPDPAFGHDEAEVPTGNAEVEAGAEHR